MIPFSFLLSLVIKLPQDKTPYRYLRLSWIFAGLLFYYMINVIETTTGQFYVNLISHYDSEIEFHTTAVNIVKLYLILTIILFEIIVILIRKSFGIRFDSEKKILETDLYPIYRNEGEIQA
jgi:hypothetical protein